VLIATDTLRGPISPGHSERPRLFRALLEA